MNTAYKQKTKIETHWKHQGRNADNYGVKLRILSVVNLETYNKIAQHK